MGTNIQLAFAGRPEQVKVNVVSVDGFGVIVMCSVADCPAVTVTEDSVVAISKLSPGVIVNDRGTLAAGL